MTKAVNFSWSFALENCITLCKAKLNGLRSIGRKTAFAEKLKNATDNNNSPTNCMECIMKYTLLIIKRMIGRVFGFGIFNFNGQFCAVLLFPVAILLSSRVIALIAKRSAILLSCIHLLLQNERDMAVLWCFMSWRCTAMKWYWLPPECIIRMNVRRYRSQFQQILFISFHRCTRARSASH